MPKRPGNIRQSFNRIKARIDIVINDGEQINANLTRAENLPAYILQLVDPLQEYLFKFRTNLLPGLQKESVEALYAGDQVMEKMEISSEKLTKSLAVLKFTYDDGDPRIEEFLSPPGKQGFGRKPDPRIRTHKRGDEAFERHKDDFPDPLAEHFDASRVAGVELEEAWNNFLKEEKEAVQVIEECINTLADYKKLRRKIRNNLKGELADPQDAYKYVPKRKIKKKSS